MERSNLPWQGSLLTLAFIEAIFFPLPPDLVLFPLCIAQPQRAFFWAGSCLGASMCGGLIAYFLGYAFMSSLGGSLVAVLHAQDQIDAIGLWIGQYGFMALLLGVFSPVPYKFIAISSGLMSVPVGLFLGASVLGRGLRFFGVAFVAQQPLLRQWLQHWFHRIPPKGWVVLSLLLIVAACMGVGLWLDVKT